MDRFDEIMDNCPFLKQIILDKIAEEVGKKDAEIVALKSKNDEFEAAVLELAQDNATLSAKNTELENAVLELASIVGGVA